ncbi:hypothetical protein F4779DRAFT_322317 [Xylariaceae sp. FL0662B]|nr:hypothetical protein F4779DRAFT_322317 [Xylariaceae sp. FL0662B]
MDSILYDLEFMAQNATSQIYWQDESDYEAIQRWQKLFGYSRTEAIQKIEYHMNDLNRIPVSWEHWEMVREEKEAEGHNKTSYSHSLSLARSRPEHRRPASARKHSVFLMKLEGPFADALAVQTIGKLSQAPVVHQGTDDTGMIANFCKIGSSTKDTILQFLTQSQSIFRPTFIPYSKAEKDLCRNSAHPTLGIDATMPQHRPNHSKTVFAPAQNEYPVWYFFYGTLAEEEKLRWLLETDPVYSSATVRGGFLKTWAGKYKALVDSPSDKETVVNGRACLIATPEQEVLK